jgi:hypothetical protein
VKLGMLVLSDNLGDIEKVLEPIEPSVIVDSLQVDEELVKRPKTLRIMPSEPFLEPLFQIFFPDMTF